MSITIAAEMTQDDGQDVGDEYTLEDGNGNVEDEDSDNSSEDDEDGEDPETIARRLGDQLWADIQKARAGAVLAAVPPVISPKEAAAITTTNTVLSCANLDALVRLELSSAIIPGTDGSSVIDILNKIVKDRRVPRAVAGPLSQALVKLAKSENLFSPLPTVPNQVVLKRKRSTDDIDASGPAKRAADDEWRDQAGDIAESGADKEVVE